MQNLLAAAAAAAEATKTVAEDNTCVMRSKGVKLSWNPCLTDKNVLVEEDSEQHISFYSINQRFGDCYILTEKRKQ